MFYLLGAFVFVVGLFIGSFLNVCIYRIPNKKSIVTPPSSCPNCDARIKWYDLVPVLSYIFLKGKCRNCGEKISPRYMLIELLTGLLFLLCYLNVGLNGQLLAYVVLTSILIVITFVDIDFQIIPDSVMIFGLIAGIVFILVDFTPVMGQGLKANAIAGLLGMLCGAGPLIVVNLLTILFIKRAGIGGGDIKLMGVVGLYLGMKSVLLALIMGIIFAGVISILILRRVRANEEDEEKSDKEEDGLKLHEIPFGPYLAVGCYVSMLYGQNIINWYFGLF